jgi:hypothetical protein
MFRGIFPKTHWSDLLDHLERDAQEIVEVEICRDGVVVDDTLVSFISEIDEDVRLLIERDELLKTRTQGLVELKYDSNDTLLVEDAVGDNRWIVPLVRPIYLH